MHIDPEGDLLRELQFFYQHIVQAGFIDQEQIKANFLELQEAHPYFASNLPSCLPHSFFDPQAVGFSLKAYEVILIGFITFFLVRQALDINILKTNLVKSLRLRLSTLHLYLCNCLSGLEIDKLEQLQMQQFR